MSNTLFVLYFLYLTQPQSSDLLFPHKAVIEGGDFIGKSQDIN